MHIQVQGTRVELCSFLSVFVSNCAEKPYRFIGFGDKCAEDHVNASVLNESSFRGEELD